MAITDPYATAEEYRAAIKPDADDAGDELILSDLVAISRYLDSRLGQFFSRDDEDVTFALDWIPVRGNERFRSDVLTPRNTTPMLPPLLSVTSIRFGTRTPLGSSGFELRPLNAPVGPEPEPYREIWPPQIISSAFASGRVTIVGQRGWPSVPVAINKTTIRLAALLRLETPLATRRIPEMGEAIETSPGAQALIWRLMDQYKVWWLA